MTPFEEKLGEIRAKLAQEDEEWERVRAALERAGDAEILLSRELLEAITAPPSPPPTPLPRGSFIRV